MPLGSGSGCAQNGTGKAQSPNGPDRGADLPGFRPSRGPASSYERPLPCKATPARWVGPAGTVTPPPHRAVTRCTNETFLAGSRTRIMLDSEAEIRVAWCAGQPQAWLIGQRPPDLRWQIEPGSTRNRANDDSTNGLSCRADLDALGGSCVRRLLGEWYGLVLSSRIIGSRCAERSELGIEQCDDHAGKWSLHLDRNC